MNTNEKVFVRRIDFYWQYIAVYSVALLAYGGVLGYSSKKTIYELFSDPVVILLACFIVGSLVGLIGNAFKDLSVIIGKDYIKLKTRYKKRVFGRSEILKISVGKERMIKLRSAYKVIKIKVNSRRRIIRIRPGSFDDDKALVKEITELKKRLGLH